MKEQVESPEIFKLKRKWQIAFRRYVLEQKPSPAYAKYFGLPIYLFREWIEMQFESGCSWDNFGKLWQFDHIVPVAYFDFNDDSDLSLCWNFINIRVEHNHLNPHKAERVDALTAKSYFEDIYRKTNYYVCRKMIEKIESIEASQIQNNNQLERFISQNQETLSQLKEFTEGDFERVNWGIAVADVIAENKLLEKFGR